MGRILKSSKLYVYMNGKFVGHLLKTSRNELEFAYANSWLGWPGARPISLSMPLREVKYTGSFVYNYFDNLLPDSQTIRNRIQTRFRINNNECFDMLSHIGADCVGAIQLLTEQIPEYTVPVASGTKISNKKISQLLHNYKSAPLGMQDDSQFRISIAGAQEKTALLKLDHHWYIPLGSTPTTHIIKLPIGYIEHAGIDLSESVQNEFICSKILQEYNLPVPNTYIEKFVDINALVVERFDRKYSIAAQTILRRPQEDMCQVLGLSSNLKYESDGGPGIIDIMKILEGAVDPIQDRYLFMKAVFLYWVMAAIDGHAKNFSVFLEDSGVYRLTPFYDIMSAYPIIVSGQLDIKKIKMAMSVRGKNKHYKWHEIKTRHWFETAKLCRFSQGDMQLIIDEIFDLMPNVIAKVKAHAVDDAIVRIETLITSNMLKLRDKN